MDKLMGNVRGKFLVDVPDANRLTGIETLPIRDYHQKHINHFTTRTMNLLFEYYGYTPIYMECYTVKSHNYPSFRVVYEYLEALDIYKTSCDKVTSEMEKKLIKLKEINYPVIVWGCGDICLHLLSLVKLDVVHYVDNDPALVGESIGGVPIYDHAESEAPIVVIAQLQRELILESIQKAGKDNRVIVI
jgi:FlaA1/EpsC-like NDP-sugar epimerase